jgi:replication fork clamp-binding protein CrfC
VPSNITTVVASIDSLTRSFKENILHELDQECVKLCTKSEPSELRKNCFDDMAAFDWKKLASEMSSRCPFLLDLLLAVMKKTKEDLNDILPRLGLCYSILMQTRNRELSLVQRLNTVLMTNGNAKKEVIYMHVVIIIFLLYSIYNNVRALKLLTLHPSRFIC